MQKCLTRQLLVAPLAIKSLKIHSNLILVYLAHLKVTYKTIKCYLFNFKIQLPLTYLRTYDVTHSRFVTHFRILKNLKNENFNSF